MSDTSELLDFGCTKRELIDAIYAGANHADVARLEGAVWRLFDRVSGFRYFMDAKAELFGEVERLRAEVERLRAEMVIGSFILRPHDAEHVWIGRPDGEGGAFAISKVEAALRAFYRENF